MAKNKSKIKTALDIDFDKLNSHIPPLPDDIDEWVHNHLFADDNYFFTQTRHSKKTGICTHCQAESQVYPYGREITHKDIEFSQAKHNDCGICPKCGAMVQFKDNGRSRKALIDYGYFYILQRVKYGGVVIRTFYCCRCWGNVNLFNNNALPTIYYSEHFRIFMHKNTHACFKRCAYNWDRYYEFWSRLKSIVKPWCYYGNMYTSKDFAVATYRPESWKEIIAKTEYKYSCLDEWALKPDIAGQYLELFSTNPTLVERMMKQGFKSVVYDKLSHGAKTYGIINFNKNTPGEAFKLSKSSINTLPANPKVINIQRAAFCESNKCSAETVKFINNLNFGELSKFLWSCKFLKPVVNANRLRKYLLQQAKLQKLYICTLISDYHDYVCQIKKLKLPLNEGIIFPPDFTQAHNQLTTILNNKKFAEESKKIEELDKPFEPTYQKLCKKYKYENNQYAIRPARGKQELFVEGSTLKHCVYSCYSDRYLAGKVLILLVRKKDEPNTPFYTMELNPKNNTVIQCKTLHNKSYELDESVSTFIKEYLQFLALPKKEQNEIKRQFVA